jgi:hypothetical protein
MKKIILALLFVLTFNSVINAEFQNAIITGSNRIVPTENSQLNIVVNEAPSGDGFSYIIESVQLWRNGSYYSSSLVLKSTLNNNGYVGTLYSFNLSEPGEYQLRVYEAKQLFLTHWDHFTHWSNTFTVLPCSSADPSISSIKMYSFLNSETFVVSNINDKSTLLKISNVGGTGANMFALSITNNDYQNMVNNSYLLGTQKFNSKITDMKYINGQTLIGFANGKVLKIAGTGGRGNNMFNVTETSSGFTPTSSSLRPSWIGDALFQSAVTSITQVGTEIFIGFQNGKLLKTNGTGGTGNNMFNITEIAGGFINGSGNVYRVGDAVFQSGITNITAVGSETFIGFANGKLLKIYGAGGAGYNMFNVSENAGGFTNGPGNVYRVGDAVFQGAVLNITAVGSELFIGFTNGKLLKTNGTGGTGGNMFNITENAGGFINGSGNVYRVGDAVFQSAITAITTIGTETFIGFANGKLLKINGTGGTGNNMFNITENAGGFTNGSGNTYRIGDANFQSAITSITSKMSITFIGFANGKLLKINGTGGSGYYMFNTIETEDGFALYNSAYPTYQLGNQLFTDLTCQTAKSSTFSIINIDKIEEKFKIKSYPNPTTGIINIEGLNTEEAFNIIIIDNLGKKVFNTQLNGGSDNLSIVDIQNLHSGIYYMTVSNNSRILYSTKIIKQ